MRELAINSLRMRERQASTVGRQVQLVRQKAHFGDCRTAQWR
jgi:hypothetical protein